MAKKRFEKRRIYYQTMCGECGFWFVATRGKPALCPKTRCKKRRRAEAKKKREGRE